MQNLHTIAHIGPDPLGAALFVAFLLVTLPVRVVSVVDAVVRLGGRVMRAVLLCLDLLGESLLF